MKELTYQTIVAKGVDPNRPGIYVWAIQGVGAYVGKYTWGTRPTRDYERNVRRLLAGKPYRLNKPDKWRKIHRALAAAVRDGRSIFLAILMNGSAEELQARERELIREIGTLNG